MDKSDDVARIVPTRSDAAVAAELRAELMPYLDHVAEILNRARMHGLTIQFTMNNDQYGRCVPVVSIVKLL